MTPDFLAARLMDLALVSLLGGVAYLDWKTRRIPNQLTVAGLAAALLLRVPLGLPALVQGLEGAGVAFAVGLVLFAIGAVAGGDAKLLTAVGAFTGPSQFVGALAATCVVGAVIAVGAAARRRALPLMMLQTYEVARFWKSAGQAGAARGLSDSGAMTIPYGVAIAIGSLLWWFEGAAISRALFS
jgi:prepilin peptidase CpaA